jgi:CHASE2 domain
MAKLSTAMVKKIAKSLGHSLLLIALHVFYFNLDWSVPLEYEMMMAMNKAESFIGGHGRFDEGKYLFINTAYDISLIKTETAEGDTGNVVITDRQMLSEFFQQLADHGNNHKYVLCDLQFDKMAENDSALKINIERVTKIILPAQDNGDKEKLTRPIFNVKSAQADYVTYEGWVSKMRLYVKENKTKTLPMQMYEDCNNIHAKVTNFGLLYKGSYIPWSIYPRYFLDGDAMKRHSMRLKYVLDFMRANGTGFYNNAIKDKILIVGNFSDDIHLTPVGSMPGSLILFNTYLTLEASYHLLGWGWFVFALISFAILCYIELIYKKGRPAITEKTWRELLVHLLGVTGWCVLISLLSGIIFRVHITIIPVIIYLELFRHFRRLFHLKRAA